MLNLDSLFLESSFDDDVSLRTTEEGFVWCDCAVDESEVIDTDPFEFITEAMYESISNVSNITFSILAESYNYLKENGYEMVEEDAKEFLNKKKDAIIAFFKKLKEKITTFFENVLYKMQGLQSKFLLLFKKAKEKGKIGFDKLKVENKKVPDYTPEDVFKWADSEMKMVVAFSSTDDDFPIPEETITTWEDELNVLKNYGKYIKDIKKAKRTALNAIHKIELSTQKRFLFAGKDEIEFTKDLTNRTSELIGDDTRVNNRFDMMKEVRKSSHSSAVRVLDISRQSVSLVMKRISYASKIVNKSIFYKEPKAEK